MHVIFGILNTFGYGTCISYFSNTFVAFFLENHMSNMLQLGSI